MFNNLINFDDFIKISEKFLYSENLNFISKFFIGKEKNIIGTWSNRKMPSNWEGIPQVQERFNEKISGDKTMDFFEYIATKFLADRQNITALSLGCGAGMNEINWGNTGKFKRIDALDISPFQIELAKNNAKQQKIQTVLNFQVGDVNKCKIMESGYDIIFTMSSLHHFSPLEEVVDKIHSLLKKDGYFILHEFVGPTKFQWTDRQMEIINSLVSIFPTKYKITFDTKKIKRKLVRPSKLRMQFGDPSEAVESGRIMELIENKFEIIDIRHLGGTILHMLFKDIAENFLEKDEETQKLLKLCFDIEDFFLVNKEINSDFVTIVCKAK